MRKPYLLVTALIVALALISGLIGFRHSDKSPATSTASNAAALKLNARAETIKTREAKAAKSDANAALALAKLLLDGSENPPNYKRARALLLSASRG